MSATRKRPQRDPVEAARIKRLVRCPDCPARIRVEGDSLGDVTAWVEHEPSCPKVPAENRARGEYVFMIINPQLLTLTLTEEDQ